MKLNGSIASSRYLSVEHSPTGIILTFEPKPEVTLGSTRRANEARRRVAGLLHRRRFKTSTCGQAILAIIAPLTACDLASFYLRSTPHSTAFGRSDYTHASSRKFSGSRRANGGAGRRTAGFQNPGRDRSVAAGVLSTSRFILLQKSQRWPAGPKRSQLDAAKTRTALLRLCVASIHD
jgi:hypothetical protein